MMFWDRKNSMGNSQRRPKGRHRPKSATGTLSFYTSSFFLYIWLIGFFAFLLSLHPIISFIPSLIHLSIMSLSSIPPAKTVLCSGVCASVHSLDTHGGQPTSIHSLIPAIIVAVCLTLRCLAYNHPSFLPYVWCTCTVCCFSVFTVCLVNLCLHPFICLLCPTVFSSVRPTRLLVFSY